LITPYDTDPNPIREQDNRRPTGPARLVMGGAVPHYRVIDRAGQPKAPTSS
jgi:hypothetical protein